MTVSSYFCVNSNLPSCKRVLEKADKRQKAFPVTLAGECKRVLEKADKKLFL